MPRFRPSKNFFILTLHTLKQSLDWPLISILTSQHMHEMCSSSAKTISLDLDLRENRKSQNFFKRCFLVGKKVLYKFPNYIASKLSHLHAVNRWFMCQPQNGQLLKQATARRPDTPPPKKFFCKFTCCYTSVPIYGSKFRNLGGGGVKKIRQLFDISKILKNRHFSAQETTNRWLIQKFKPRCVEYPGAHL